MNDGESINLEYFGKNNLPENLEKRAKALMNALGKVTWELDFSF